MYKPNKAKLFGAALKQLLSEKKLSQRRFAKQAELDASYVSKLVNPKPGKEIEEPRKEIRQKLAKGLGITEEELLAQIARYSDSEAEKTISAPPGLAESEEAIAKPHRESVESDAGSIEERIFKATNQLDPERPVFSRMSAIQALGKIAADPRYHWDIMEILAAFVRNNARRKEEEEGEEERSLKISEDIQAALTIIGRCGSNKDSKNRYIDLRQTNLTKVDLSQAHLEHIDFTRANLSQANLSRANLKAAILKEANLEGANLDGADLDGANLFQTVLSKARFRGASLEKAILIQTDLSWACLQSTNLRGIHLNKANLKGADLSGVNLSESHLQEANLEGVKLATQKSINCLVKPFNPYQIKFTEVNMEGVVLRGANLKGVNLCEANLRRANLSGANLKGANFSRAKNLNLGQLSLACGDSMTVLPNTVERPAHWM